MISVIQDRLEAEENIESRCREDKLWKLSTPHMQCVVARSFSRPHVAW